MVPLSFTLALEKDQTSYHVIDLMTGINSETIIYRIGMLFALVSDEPELHMLLLAISHYCFIFPGLCRRRYIYNSVKYS